MPRISVTDLELLTREGDWELWRFTVTPRSLRFLWVQLGQFPAHIFDPAQVLLCLDKTEDRAHEAMERLRHYEETNHE
jgi:hypothetical protein